MPRLSFSLRDVFWLTLVVGLSVGWWMENPSRRVFRRWFSPSVHSKVYYLQDVADVDEVWFDETAQNIKMCITPDQWTFGPASLEKFETNHSLVIFHTPEGHEGVAEHLADLRIKLGLSPEPYTPPR